MEKEATYQLSEADIVSGLHAGDIKILSYLYDHYCGALYGMAYRVVGVREFAEEVIQDAFMKIWKNRLAYDASKGRIFTWMLRIVRNEAIDKRRSAELRKQSKTTSIDDNVYTIDQYKQTGIRVDDIGVKNLLKHLEERDQRILDLIYFQGYTHVQTAEILQIPLGTIKTRLRMCISHLRKKLVNQ